MNEDNLNNESTPEVEVVVQTEQNEKNFFKRIPLAVKIILSIIALFIISISILLFISYQQGSEDNYIPPEIEEMADQDQAEDDLNQISSAVEAFYAQNLTYPSILDELVPDFINKLPLDPKAKKPYLYETEGDSYIISVVDPKLYNCEYFYYENGFLTKE